MGRSKKQLPDVHAQVTVELTYDTTSADHSAFVERMLNLRHEYTNVSVMVTSHAERDTPL